MKGWGGLSRGKRGEVFSGYQVFKLSGSSKVAPEGIAWQEAVEIEAAGEVHRCACAKG
jgi:hypothetical protein